MKKRLAWAVVLQSGDFMGIQHGLVDTYSKELAEYLATESGGKAIRIMYIS